MKKIDVFSLLTKPLWQLSGEEYVALHAFAAKRAIDDTSTAKTVTRCTGARELAQFLSCCESTVYAMKREGVLDDCIQSAIGKSTVFLGEKARERAQAYMDAHRKSKKTTQNNNYETGK